MGVGDAGNLGDLLCAVAAGDRAAFRRLYDQAAPRLFAVALRLLRRRDLADEALQDAFVAIWRNAARFDAGRGAALSWMISILRYRALDALRRNRAVAEETPLDDDMPAPETGWSADAHALHACLATLEENQRRCIQMAFVDGYTHEELARRLDAPIGTVKSWIRRGLSRLKACLEQ